MIEIKTKWRTNDYGCYYLAGWSVHRRIAKRELVALHKPDGEVIYGRATRTRFSYNCRDCMLCVRPPDGNIECCPVARNGRRSCYLCGDRPTGKYKFIKVDLNPALENL